MKFTVKERNEGEPCFIYQEATRVKYLKREGMSSPEFLDADRKTGLAIVRYRQKATECGVELYGTV